MKKLTIILFLVFNNSNIVFGQSRFRFPNENRYSQKLSFQLINNIIVIPVEVNNTKLSFILDTGVDKTILFSLSENDSLGLKNVKKISLHGLGKGKAIDALISQKNKLKVGALKSNDETIYVVLKDQFELSGKMGTTIHGIIGYSLLKDVIAKINYKTKKIILYNPKNFQYKKCKKCEEFPVEFYRNKPYVDAAIQLDTIGNEMTSVKMLIDTGGSDALWLFEESHEKIKTPLRHYNDILGEGLSGTIYGNRARIPKVRLGKFEVLQPTVSFLDTISTLQARKFETRNGSIGSNILKRFKVWIDYPNKKLILRKCAALTGGFEYNMSGLDIVYNGEQLVKEMDPEKVISYSGQNSSFENNSNTITFSASYRFKFKPSYRISKVLQNSPAALVGIYPDDILLKINGNSVHDLSIGQLIKKLQTKDGKKIRVTIRRGEDILKFQFKLKKRV
ncbi:MAG: aspartyl protease family protein [Polaribacter sp.]|nr:aspartyl protease family protein [Polaribacter sp.]MDG1321006.1 aspartyl protease family protein [Polaribacter sp.]